MAFRNAASVVVAQIFELVDTNGVIVAQFTSGGPGNAPGLFFLNYDALTSDSILWWSEVAGTGGGSPGNEEIALTGPRLESTSAFDPSIQLGVSAASAEQKYISIGDANAIFIDTTNSADDAQTGIDMFGNGEHMDMFGRTITLNNDSVTVLSYSTASARGQIYPVSFEDKVSAGAAIPNTGITLITLAVINYPVAGWIDVTATIEAQVAIINDSLTVAINIDGAGVRIGHWTPGPEVVGTVQVTTINIKMALAAGNHTIRFDAAAVTNNAYNAVATNTHLAATYYR